MKKNSLFIAVAVIAVMFTSCTVGRYVNNSQNVNLNQTQVVLSQANFKVVKDISTTFVYENKAGKFSAEQLKQSAYAQLVKEEKLTGAQTIINVTMEEVQRVKSTLIPGVANTKSAIIVSGTIIEFTK